MADNLDKRYQTLVVLWFALLLNVAVLFVVSLFVGAAISGPAVQPVGSIWFIALLAVGTLLVLASFAVKQKLLRRAVDNQDLALVQKSLVVACALCEACALLGFIARLAFGNREYYLLFLLGAAGTLIHFPRRLQLEAASYKKSGLFG